MKKSKLAFAAVAASLLLVPMQALAAVPGALTKSAGLTGISISPFSQQISIDPSDASQSYNLQLTNHTKSIQEIDLTTRDFGSLNDSGGVLLEGSNSNYASTYGLTSWLVLGSSSAVLNPGESTTIPVTVDNRDSLQPGGHYGAIVASVNSQNDQSGNQVAINQQLLSLVLVTKTGGEHYDLKLNSVTQNGNWLHLPNTVMVRFQNPGNVHVTPRGLVQLKSPNGTVVAQGIVNDESAFVLPESFRDLYVPLTPVGRSLPLPGLYHVSVQYRYDGLARSATQTFPVRFINLGGYIITFLILVAIYRIYRWRRLRTKHHQPTKKSDE